MKRTYERTMMIEDLTKAVVELHVFNECKYTEELGEHIVVKYRGVKSWSIISGGKEAEAIENIVDADGIDENHEYLVLHFEDGTTSTFRNSYVDMFVF